MGFIYVLLSICTAILATNGCLLGETHMCHSGHPLIVGGRIQPLVREGELLDPFWNNEGRRFVFQWLPGRHKDRIHRMLHGRRGVIRTGERTCSGRSDVQCPIPTSDMPCGMAPSDMSASAPLVFSNIASTSVNVSWEDLDGFARRRDPPITWYLLRYREVEETSSDFEQMTVSEPPSYTVLDLEPDTLYEFQLVPMSDDVTEVIKPTRVQTVRTLCGVPPIPSFTKSATTSRSVTLDVGLIVPEVWKCSDMDITLQEQVEDSWEDMVILNKSDPIAVVEDLTPCSSYSYRLYVSNIHETSVSEVQDIETDAEGHGGVVQPSGESIEPGRMTISWMPPDMIDTACDVSSYLIEYSFVRHKACPGDDQSGDVVDHVIYHLTVAGTETSTLLSDLEDYADYNVSITPLVDGLDGPLYGETVSFVESTTMGVPPTPSFTKSATTSRSVTFDVGLLVPEVGKCSDMDITLQVQVEGSWEDGEILNKSDPIAVVEDLTPCSSYSYRLYVSNIHETSVSEVLDIETDAEGHGGVMQLAGESIEPGRMNISWMPPDMNDTACDVSSYLIEYSFVRHKACLGEDQPGDVEDHVIHQVEVAGTETSALLSNLEDYADYNVSITSLVDGSDGPIYGESVSFVESTTTGEPSGIPDGVLLNGVSQSHLTFTWNSPSCVSQNGIITGYSYILEEDSVVVSTGTVDTNTVKIGGLNPDTEYTFRVAATTVAGPGSYSQPITEATRFRGCRGKNPLRLGGILTSLSGDRPPWGSGQPVFATHHHSLFRNGHHFGRPFGHGGIIKIWRRDHGPCEGSSRSGSCPAAPETPREIPRSCSEMESPGYSCEAAHPRFSYDRGDVITFERLSLADVKVTWRDWEVTKDKGVGPVTGYLLRYRRRGETIKEIHKGLSLHHTLFNLSVNANYEFEVFALKEGTQLREGTHLREVDILPVPYTTGCGELDPVQNITVVTNNERSTLIVSWSPPVGFCPIEYYEYTKQPPVLKACPESPEFSHSYTELFPDETNETSVTLRRDWNLPLEDFADYNISVTPVTAMINGGGYLKGETISIIGTTIEHVPDFTPKPSVNTSNPTSVVLSWDDLACGYMRGNFTMYKYTLQQHDGLVRNGTTTETRVEIEGLTAFMEFSFDLQIHTTGGAGPVSTVTNRTAESTELTYENQTSVLDIENVTSSSVTLSWPEWNELHDNGTGTVLTYIIYYRERGEDQHIHDAGLNLSATIDGLKLDTEYDFDILIVGRGPGRGIPGMRSDAQTVQTQCGVPTTPQLSLVRVTTPTVAILQTEIPGEEGWGCRKVDVYLQMAEGDEWDDGEGPIEHAHYTQLEGLIPCTDITYRLKMNNTHHTVYSEPINLATNGELGPVRNLTVTPTDNPGELYIHWEEPERINTCPITSYIVEYHVIGDKACEHNLKEYIDLKSVNETYVTIADLQPYSYYNVEVSPVLRDYGGYLPPTEFGVGLTKTDIPSETLHPWVNFNASSIRELQFSWRELACEHHNGPNLTYLCELYLTNSGRPVLEDKQVVTSETCTFKDLRACGNYSFMVRPGNNAGLGNASAEVTARIPATALGPVENITTIARPDGAVSVRWERDEITNLCPVSGYKLNYVLQRQQACRVCVDLVQPPLHTNGSSYVLENLASFATYKINISVQLDEGSVGLVLKEKVFTTMSSAPTEAPVAWVDDSLTTAYNLTFKWNSINCSSLNGIFKQYTFRSNATKGETGISNRRRRSLTLRNLQPCTTYDFQIRAVNSMGGGPFGTAVGTTALGTPGREFNLDFEILTGGSVLLTWQNSIQNPCQIDSFIIVALLTEDLCDPDGSPPVETTLGGDTGSIHLAEILAEGSAMVKAKSVYQVTLRAHNLMGDGKEDFLEINTPELEPSGPPSAIIQLSGTSDSATMTWDNVPCDERNGVIEGYSYSYRKGGVFRSGTTADKSVTLKELEPEKTYYFKVKASTSAGYGPFSEEIEMRTTN